MPPPNELEMPDDFPEAAYYAVGNRMAPISEIDEHLYGQLAGAWNGLKYRFLACTEHDINFTQAIRNSSSPSMIYIQQRELFGFFVTGLASLDCFGYGLFSMATVLNEQNFPLRNDNEMRRVDLVYLSRKFTEFYPQEPITDSLGKLLRSSEFSDWKEMRNVLTHRAVPGRMIFLSNRPGFSRPDELKYPYRLQLDTDTTASRRRWLAEILQELMLQTDNFTQKYFTETS